MSAHTHLRFQEPPLRLLTQSMQRIKPVEMTLWPRELVSLSATDMQGQSSCTTPVMPKIDTMTSGRRYDELGVVKSCVTYALNYWWPVFFHRPYTQGSQFVASQLPKEVESPNI